MYSFLLKRLLLAVPSLWLILTLVFLLSRLLPGHFGAETILKETDAFYSTGDVTAREAAHASFMRKTGQDLPVFYLSIHAAAEPTPAELPLQAQERLFLKRLAWNLGDARLAVAFYQRIKMLEQGLSPEERKILQPQYRQLYASTAPDSIQAAVLSLEQSGIRGKEITKLKKAAAILRRQQPAYQAILPVLRWHGINNQYHLWLAHLLHGDLGRSFRDNRTVATIMAEAFVTTFVVLLASLAATMLLSVELSFFMLKQSHRHWRRLLLPLLFLIDRIPSFLLALVLLLLFASPDYFQIFPVFGLGHYSGPQLSWPEQLYNMGPYLVLPVICLSLVGLPYLTNQFYRALADAVHTDYARTARAKGLTEATIFRKHIFRNALLPVITLLSDFIPALVAGAVVIETVFALPGMGSLLVQSVQARDYPVVVGIVLAVAFAKIISHLLADLLYSWADPRIKLARA